MADSTYSIGLVDQVSPALKKIEGNLGALNRSFSGLQTVFAGLFAAATIKGAMDFASNISDMSKATGVAVQNIVGLSSALLENGGSADAATKMLSKLSLTIEDANSGALKTSDAFADIGISLQDLKSLSDTDIMTRTIMGLSKVEDASKRAALATSLLGKGAKGIDFAGVGGDIGKATAAAAAYSVAIEKAAGINDKMATVMQNFQMSLLNAISPLLDYLAALDPDQITRFVDALVKIGGAAVAFTVLGKAVGYVGSALATIGGLWAIGSAKIVAGIAGITAGFASISRTIGITVGYIARFFSFTPMFAQSNGFIANLVTLLEKLAARWGFVAGGTALAAGGIAAFASGVGAIALAIAGVAATAYGLGTLFDSIFDTKIVSGFTDGVAKLYDKTKAFLGLKATGGNEAGGRRAQTAEEIAGIQKHADELQKVGKIEREQLDSRLKGLNEFKLSQAQVTSGYKDQNKLLTDKLALELGFIGMSSDEVERQRAIVDVYDRQNAAVIDLTKQQQALKLAMAVPGTSAGEVTDLNNRYNVIAGTIANIKTETISQVAAVGSYVDKIQVARSIELDRQNILEGITKQIERQATLADQVRGANDKLVDVKFAGSQAGKNPLEAQMAQIQEDARKAALEAGRSFSAGFEGMDLTTAQAAELANGLDEIAQKYKAIATEQTSQLDVSRTFEAGWKKAFDSYVDNATNAATKAGDLFNAVTSGMNSAIDNFVDNGKFSFSDFANSMIKDMLKIELKASAMNLMKMMNGGGSGGGNILSSIGSMLGFANGGDPPIGKASIVGENGPEIITPRGATTVIPNGAGGGGQQITNNYYTVNAVDAKSVAQLFAENRKTLLGSIKMAEKELPYKIR